MSKVKNAVSSAIYNEPNNKESLIDKENIEKNLYSKTWDDMEKMYIDLITIIANASQGFLELVRLSENELAPYISDEDKKQIKILSHGFSRDILAISEDALKVHNSHKDFKGKQDNDNELFMSISVLEAYITIHDKAINVLPSSTALLIEIVGEASEKLSAAQGAANVH